MELGTGFLVKLEPFLLMSKYAKGAAAAKLIQDATSAPGVFVFGELLDAPNIQELASNEQFVSHLHLLQLFAYRTFNDYLRNKDSLPPLNQAQITKLKHLSLVSLAMERRILPYADLLESLQTPFIRELEDLIIDAIYQDVIQGKLDQKEQQFEVEYTMGRDLEPGKIESILDALKAWADTTSSVLAALDGKLASLASNTAARHTQEEEYEKDLAATIKYVMEKQKEAKSGAKRETQKLGMGGRSDKDKDSMDVDEPLEGKGKNKKAPDSSTKQQQRKRNRFGL